MWPPDIKSLHDTWLLRNPLVVWIMFYLRCGFQCLMFNFLLACVCFWRGVRARQVASVEVRVSMLTLHPPTLLLTLFASWEQRRPTMSSTGFTFASNYNIVSCLPLYVTFNTSPWKHYVRPSPIREKLLDFLYSVKQPDGSFVMHVGGEVDVRWALPLWFPHTLELSDNCSASLFLTVWRNCSEAFFFKWWPFTVLNRQIRSSCFNA